MGIEPIAGTGADVTFQGAGIPSLGVAAGLAANGLPAGVCLEGPPGSDHRLLALGKALQDEIGTLLRPRRPVQWEQAAKPGVPR